MDSELQRIAAKLSELSQLEPGLGYRAYHSKLKEHADFASISLKKVEIAMFFVPFSIFSVQICRTYCCCNQVTESGRTTV